MIQPDPSIAEWSQIKKQLFRFFFIFFILYIFLNPNEVIPYSFYLHKLYIRPCTGVIEWAAKDMLHLADPATTFYNGTLDTVFGYITVLFIFFAAAFASFIWLALDRKNPGYPKLYHVLILILRYYLAITWIAYGSIKIIQLQFPPLSPVTLLQTYGGSTPKDLAWSFMGYSSGYNLFFGVIEVSTGLLLFFRRTRALGSLISLGILANVVAFNYSFDVNVKLLSTVLIVMTIFLLSKDITRLFSFFFLNKIVYPEDDQPFYFKTKWKNRVLIITKYAFILFIIIFDLRGDFIRAKQNDARSIGSPLYGIYNVTAFIRNRDTIKPLTTDTTRWNKLIIGSAPGNAAIMLMNDSLKYLVLTLPKDTGQLEMYAKTDTADRYTFDYSVAKDSSLVLHGKWHHDSLEIRLREYNMNKFPLMNRHFRWINDRNLKR